MAECEDPPQLELPSHLFHNKTGISLDFGGSLIKIVFATAEGDMTRFHFCSYPRENRLEAFEFLQSLVKRDLSNGPIIYTCGIGSNEFHDDLRDVFNKEVKNLSEGDVQMEALQFLLSHKSVDELVHADDPTIEAYTDSLQTALAGVYKTWCSGDSKMKVAPFVRRVEEAKKCGTIKNDEVRSPRTLQYPYFVQTVGSAGFINMAHEDGRFDFIDDIPISGRYFLSMGSLLTETDNYEELIRLVDEGISQNVDVDQTSLPMNDSDPMYNSLRDLDRTCFSFGKAYGKTIGDFEKKDLARALMSQLAFVTGLAGHTWALKLGVKQIFVVGGLPGASKTFRRLLGTEMSYRNKCLMVDEQTDFMFVKLGAHLCALGALLHTLGVK